MESTSVAEQRAKAVAKLKRAASLPRMKDGRRPPMHVEAVSEGERHPGEDKPDEDSAHEPEGKPDPPVVQIQPSDVPEPDAQQQREVEVEEEPIQEHHQHQHQQPPPLPPPPPPPEDKQEEQAVPSPERPPTPGKKRRSRSRTRSRNSKDLRKQQQPVIITSTTESSADENYTSGVPDDAPPSPPLVSPIPSHFAGFPVSRLLRSPISPPPNFFYPGTQPPTPMLPSLDDIQRGLFRSNSVGAARAMAMHQLTGEPLDMSLISPSSTPPPFSARLARNNTVAGGERIAARKLMLRRLGERFKEPDGDQTSGGEETAPSSTPVNGKRRRRRSRHNNNSRPSTVLDDRDDRELPSTSFNVPGVPASPPPRAGFATPDPPWPPEILHVQTSATPPAPTFEYEPPMGGRGVLVEPEDEDMDRVSPQKPFPGLPITPSRSPGLRIPHASDAPSSMSSESAQTAGIPVSFFFPPGNGAYRLDGFPASPFATPLKEKPEYEEEESETYAELRARSVMANRAAFERDSEISWIAEPVPRIPVNEGESDDDSDEELEPEQEAEPEPEPGTLAPAGVIVEPIDTRSSRQSLDDGSPLGSPHSRDYIVEPDNTADALPPFVSSTSFSAAVLSTPAASDQSPLMQPSPSMYPMRLSVATPNQLDRSPSANDWHDDAGTATDSTPKRGNEGTWERVKNAFSRSNSANGRRSRTNSIGGRDRRYNTDSSVSRESGASQLSPNKNESFAQQQPQPQPQQQQPAQGQTPLMQTPSASASILSLAPPVLSGSPIPPASSADLYKYADSKLFPFPGIIQLEEKRNRAKGVLSPDVVLTPNGNGNGLEAVPSSGSSSSATTRSPEVTRERKLSHQMSDSRLVAKYNGLHTPPAMIAPASSTTSQADYFSLPTSPVPPPPSASPSPAGLPGSLKLPMNREGVKTWLKVKKLLSSQSSSNSSVANQPPPMMTTSASTSDLRAPPLKKPSLSDLLLNRKDIDLSADWEEISNDKLRTPTSAISTANSHLAKYFARDDAAIPPATTTTPTSIIAGDHKDVRVNVNVSINGNGNGNGHIPHPATTPTPETPQSASVSGQMLFPRLNGTPSSHTTPDISGYPSPPDPPSSTTPDPQSSLDEFPTRSTTTDSYSSLPSSRQSPDPPTAAPSRSALVLERLDEVFGRGSKSSLLPTSVDDPPRRLVLSSPVLQVANANIVKDRFLFLFTDLIVIAKPVSQDQDMLLGEKPAPLERRFVVKSVVLLKDLKFCPDRDDSRLKTAAAAAAMRHPVVRGFVHQFSKDVDQAIASLFEKSTSRDDPVALGQLMFRINDLDRARLGEYLSRRTSKIVLKAYLDGFGFTGLRVDKALRVFLLAICVPKQANALEYLMDAFSSRWYEANSGIVAYDKDLATRLVRAIVQLNEVLHDAIAQTPGITGYPKRNVMSQDFVSAFRRADSRGLVSDDLLEKIYASIRRERLSQARSSSNEDGIPDSVITIKRPLPSRLTYRVQSEPVVLRIPQPDPHLTVQLFGQDLVFDPPALTFAKSSEASFRITGTSLGPKTIIMWRAGPNALAYSGLPQSSLVIVERSFMRNTFQLAFANHIGAKRKYMFSVDDSLVRHQWSVAIKRQIDIATVATAAAAAAVENSGQSLKAHLAAEALAFKVLQDTLIAPDEDGPSAIDEALARLTGASFSSPSPPRGANGSGFFRERGRSKMDGPSPTHARSKSRSQVYHKHGPGKLEPEEDLRTSSDDARTPSSMQQRPGERVWNGRDLEVVCQQNSTIVSVLTYLLGPNVGQGDNSSGS